MTTPVVSPGLRTPLLTDAIKRAHLAAARSPIAIYPEVVSANPLGTRNVVRYLLAEPALHTGQPIHLQASDLVYTFGPTLVPKGWTADPLRMPLVDTRIFNSDGVDDRRRHGSAVFIHRHLKKGGRLHPVTANSIEISYRVPERSAQEMAEIFRQVECLYMYEPSTAAFEALLCGCPVVYITNEVSLPRADLWLMDGKGISWGLEPADIVRAKATVHEVQDFYRKEEATFWRDLYALVEKTQAHAVSLNDGRISANSRAGQSSPATVPAQADTLSSKAAIRSVLILDADGDMEKIQLSLRALAKGPHENLMTVVLTTLETELPEWTVRLRYLKATTQEYASALEQLCALPTFDWALITEAGTAQYA